MPISLTLLPANTEIDASVLRARLLTTQHYLNEQIEAADRGTSWCQANHIYRPDFFGNPDNKTSMVSGENYFVNRPSDSARRGYFAYQLGEGPFLVPGLTRTLQFPESLQQGSIYYRLNVFASFYAYEFGGDDGDMDESTYLAAAFHLGTTSSPTGIRDRTVRAIYKGSQTYLSDNYVIYPRKQHSLMWAFAGNVNGLTTPGVQTVGVWVKPFIPATTSPPFWKHIVIQQANLIARYRIR